MLAPTACEGAVLDCPSTIGYAKNMIAISNIRSRRALGAKGETNNSAIHSGYNGVPGSKATPRNGCSAITGGAACLSKDRAQRANHTQQQGQ